MKYDFDMFSIIPDDVQSQFQGMFNELGMGAMAAEQKALWRDPKVVSALHGADQIVKDLFLNAGFGINHYTSGAPDDRFLKRDEQARQRCQDKFLDTLSDAIKNGSLQGANWNGFDVRAFLHHLETAEPIDEIEVQELALMEFEARKAAKRRKLLGRLGLAIGIIAVTYAVSIVLGGQTNIASAL